ncbi:hypothetical protein [Aurantiacibacter sediminis]|uniref:DUF2029 domain-containing protein n=1 Tax=Aurantiacibacter sediminis TaxID=2793064 RepID=A0ABS0MZ89_9SPHN|nr:hypothetical protein [Aurantiacibacter sediminis]MBH5321032.1 hypothetical protein [Aurantiacibacter sediminis]
MSIARDPIGWWDGLDRPLRHLPRAAAAFLCLLLGALMVWAVLAPNMSSGAHQGPATEQVELEEGDGDLALYSRISDRVIAGEDYYTAAMDEQRSGNYPTRPFVTVRPPTLAILHATIGTQAVSLTLKALLPIAILLFMARLKGQVLPVERAGAGIAMLFGGAGVIIPEAYLIHEIVAGLLLSLAFASYRPHRWWPALLLAGMALAVRELAAPFVFLWLAFALLQRRWSEAVGIGLLLALFGVGMYLHYLGVEAQRLPGDVASQGWNALAGPILPLTALSRLTVLLLFPLWLAVPLAILPLLGWIGLGRTMGLFAAIWFTGFFTAMALFARPENFYWVQLTLPIYLAGLAFAPRAVVDLFTAARGQKPTLS